MYYKHLILTQEPIQQNNHNVNNIYKNKTFHKIILSKNIRITKYIFYCLKICILRKQCNIT